MANELLDENAVNAEFDPSTSALFKYITDHS